MKSFAAIFLVVLSLLGAGCGDGLAERLKAEGVQTEASIAFKREVGNGRSRNYSFTLYYFAKDSAAIAKEKAQKDILKDSTLSMIDRLDKWEPGAGGIGTLCRWTSTFRAQSSTNIVKASASRSATCPAIPNR
jgi:hypothetical protein